MPPNSSTSNEVEVMNSSGDDEQKVPFMQRMKTRIVNLIKSFRLFVYNKEYKTFFGNSSSFWIKTAIYYFFFYVCLGLFYSGMIAVFGAIISRESPTYWFYNSQMNDGGKVNLGMGFRPMPDISSTSLTLYNDTASQNDTTSSLRAYRIEYLTQYDTTYLHECSPTEPASELPASGSCRFSWEDIVTNDLHPCSDGNMYGWSKGQPCILIKLNKVYGWQPAAGSVANQVANATRQAILPVDLRESNIYITCDGKADSDKKSLGSMMYYSILHPLGIPNYGGIPYYFYPYLNSKDHVEPFVLVQFLSLSLEQKITIECRAWAPNIEQLNQGTTRRGLVSFDIFRTDKAAPQKT